LIEQEYFFLIVEKCIKKSELLFIDMFVYLSNKSHYLNEDPQEVNKTRQGMKGGVK
jgi:hypothetical protein